MNDQAEAIKRSLTAVLPGMAVTLMGCLLMLAAGVMIVTEGADLVRNLTVGLSKPWRTLAMLSIIGGALVVVAYTGRFFMGYTLTRIRKGDE